MAVNYSLAYSATALWTLPLTSRAHTGKMSVPTQPSSTGDHEYLVTPGEQNTQTNGIKPVHQDSDDHPDHAKEAYRLFNVWKDVRPTSEIPKQTSYNWLTLKYRSR